MDIKKCVFNISGVKVALGLSYLVFGVACIWAGFVGFDTEENGTEVLFTGIFMGILYLIPAIYLAKNAYRCIKGWLNEKDEE